MVRAPRITEVTPGRSASQASATCAIVDAAALGHRADGVDHVPGALLERAPVVGLDAALRVLAEPGRAGGRASRAVYLPVSQPPPSGDQGSSPSPASRQDGTISHSISRTSRLYCGCSVTGRRSPAAVASATAFCTCQPVKFDSPT